MIYTSWTLYLETTDKDGWTTRIDVIHDLPHTLDHMWTKAVPYLEVPNYFHGKRCEELFELLKVGLTDIMDNYDAYNTLFKYGADDFDKFFEAYVHLVEACIKNPTALITCKGLNTNMTVHLEALKIEVPVLAPKEDLFSLTDEQLLARKAARERTMKLQAKHIKTKDMMALIDAICAIPKIHKLQWDGFEMRKTWANTADIFALWPDIPQKVILAKLRNLDKKGLVDGCACGCYGGFTVTDKGRKYEQ
jgi:hypothetical protein